ncbi:unnamed protein product [Ectocarpus sp. 12 AP-2014]
MVSSPGCGRAKDLESDPDFSAARYTIYKGSEDAISRLRLRRQQRLVCLGVMEHRGVYGETRKDWELSRRYYYDFRRTWQRTGLQ